MIAASADPIAFWDGIPADARWHPADRLVLERSPHSLKLCALPNPFFGPLATAPVALLYLNPAFNDEHERDAGCPEKHAYYLRQRSGNGLLPTSSDLKSTHDWLAGKIAQFGRASDERFAPDQLRDRLAVVNLCAYRSVSFSDRHMLAALPSSRVILDWAQATLFPQAEREERVVVCLRAAKYWGLGGDKMRGHLFAPDTNRSGMMTHGAERKQVVAHVRAALNLPPLSDL